MLWVAEHAGDELGVAPVVLAPGVRRRPLHLGDGGHGAVEAERAQLARHVEPGGAALVARPRVLEAEGPLRDLGGVGAEAAAHHLAGEGVERRGGDRSRVDVQADGGNMGHGKPPPRRCGKGYRTGRYSKPIVAPRARGKKLRRGGGGPNGFLISSFCHQACRQISHQILTQGLYAMVFASRRGAGRLHTFWPIVTATCWSSIIFWILLA